MVTVRSVRTDRSTAAGRAARNWGRMALTRSTTAMTLAPGWRWMLRTMAGLPFTQAAWRTSSGPVRMAATSDRRTGRPSR